VVPTAQAEQQKEANVEGGEYPDERTTSTCQMKKRMRKAMTKK
jgi:hypothetical protein